MSLLRTAKSTKLGSQRLGAYNKEVPSRNTVPETTQSSLGSSSKADNNSSLADSKWQFSEVGTVGSSMQTDEDIKEILRQATANVLGKQQEESTISTSSVPSVMRTLSQGSGSSSNFSVSKAFGVTKKKMKDNRTKTPSPLPVMTIDTSLQGSKQGLMSLDKNITVASSFSISVQREEVQPSHSCAVSNKLEITQDRASKLLKDESKKRATKLLQKLDETKRVRTNTTSKREFASESPELFKSNKKSQKQKLLERLEKMGVKPEEVGLSTDGHTVGRSKSNKTKKNTRCKSANPFDDDVTVDVGDKYAPMALNDDFMQDVMAMAAGHLGGIENAKSMDEILNSKEAQPDALHMLVKPESADMDEFLNLSKLGPQKAVLAKAKAARANQANVAPSFGKGKPPQSPMVRANSMTEGDADWVAQDLRRKNELEKEVEECSNECSLWSNELFDKPDEEVVSAASPKAPHSPSVKTLSERLAAISGKSKVSARDHVTEELGDFVGLDALGDALTIESNISERYMSTEASIIEKRESFAEKAASKANIHKALISKKALPQDAGTVFCDMMENAVAPSIGGSCQHKEDETGGGDGNTSDTANWCVSLNGMVPPNQCHQTSVVRPNTNSPKEQNSGDSLDRKSPNSIMDIDALLQLPEQLAPGYQLNTSQAAVATSRVIIPADINAVSPSAQSRKSDFFDKGSLLDQDDAFWDSLSTIASSAHLKQHGQVVKADQPNKLEKIDEEGIVGCGIGCPWQEDQQPSATIAPVTAMTVPKAIEAANRMYDDSDSDFSVAPSIPVEITYRASSDDGMAGRSMIGKLEAVKGPPNQEQPVGKTMDNLQTLLSGDSSSCDSSLLYSATGTTDNEEETHITAEELEKAMMRGLEMATTNDESTAQNSLPSSPSSLNRRASKYGEDDQGEQPLCSPSLPSHDSDSQPANASPVDELNAIVGNIEGMDITVISPVNSVSKKADVTPKKKNSRVSSMLAKFQSTREDMNYMFALSKRGSENEISVAAKDNRLQAKPKINDDGFDLGAIDRLLMDGADDDSYDTSALLLVVTRTEDEPNTVSSLEDVVPEKKASPRAPINIEERYDELSALPLTPRSRVRRLQDKESRVDHRSPIKIEERYEEVEVFANLEQMRMDIPAQLPPKGDTDADSSLEVQAQMKSKQKKKGPKSKDSPKSKKAKEENMIADFSRNLKLEIDDLVMEKLWPPTEKTCVSPTVAVNRAHQRLPKDELVVSPELRRASIPQEFKPVEPHLSSMPCQTKEKSSPQPLILSASSGDDSLGYKYPKSSRPSNQKEKVDSFEVQTSTVSQKNKKRYESPTRTDESPSTPRLDSIRARLDEKRRLRNFPASPGLLRAHDASLIVPGRSSSTRSHLEASLASPVAPPEAGPEVVAMQEMLEKYDTMVNQLLKQNGKLKRHGNADDISVGADSTDLRRMLLQLRRQKEQAVTTARSGSAGRSRPSTPSRGRGPPKPEDASPRVLLSPRAQDDSPTQRRSTASKATTVLRSAHSPLAGQHQFHFDYREPRSLPMRMASPERHSSPLRINSPNRRRTSPLHQERYSSPNRQRAESGSPSRQRFLSSPERNSRWSSPERHSRLPSPERRRRIAFAHDNAEQARSLREQLDMARLTSQSIRTNQSSLSMELQAFKKKLNEKRKERTMMSAFRDSYDDDHNHDHASRHQFHQEEGQFYDLAVDPWGNPDDVRDMMLSNLKLMNDAQDALLSERMRIEAEELEESDEERLYRLERAISDIRLAEQTNSGRVMQCLDDARSFLHAETQHSKSHYNL